MRSDPIRVIVNPAASGGRGRKAAHKLFALLDGRSSDYEARYTEAPGHASRLARTAAVEGVARIVVVGGDGTIHEVAGGLLASQVDRLPPVAVFPVGTGNDFYRMIGTRRSAAEVVDVLEAGLVERFDVGRVRWRGGERVFVNLLGVGVDVEVVRCRARFSRLPGLPQYLAAFLSAIATFKPPEVHVEVGDGARQHIMGATTLTVVTVGPSIGGGFMICPDAHPSDGKLDLCHIAAPGLLPILRLVPKVIRGRHGDSPLVTMRQLEEAVIRRPGGEPMWFEFDGELPPEPASELRIRILPGALPVLVPARG
jgi:diacylglycerol kinase (ATP)